MNWIAVDIGSYSIKVAALDAKRKVVPLLFSEDNHLTSNLPTEIYIDDKNIIIGEHAALLGTLHPECLNSEWTRKAERQRGRILKELYLKLRHAAQEHYSEQETGIVLLYEEMIDREFAEEALKHFCAVKAIKCSDAVIQSLNQPKDGLSLVVDMGHSSLKIHAIDGTHGLSFSKNEDLGFRSVDVGHIMEKYLPASCSDAEIAVYGSLLQSNIIRMSQGRGILSPFMDSRFSTELQESFKLQLKQHIMKCIEEIASSINKMHKTWGDFRSITFCGGGAANTLLRKMFNEYIGNRGKSIIIKDCGNTPSMFWVRCALNMPLKNNGGILGEPQGLTPNGFEI